jgi:hypothetical protein
MGISLFHTNHQKAQIRKWRKSSWKRCHFSSHSFHIHINKSPDFWCAELKIVVYFWSSLVHAWMCYINQHYTLIYFFTKQHENFLHKNFTLTFIVAINVVDTINVVTVVNVVFLKSKLSNSCFSLLFYFPSLFNIILWLSIWISSDFPSLLLSSWISPKEWPKMERKWECIYIYTFMCNYININLN